MKKLTLEHLAGYLPYGLRIKDGCEITEMVTNTGLYHYPECNALTSIHSVMYRGLKPILHPLSDLTKEIEVGGEKFVPLIKLSGSFGGHSFNSVAGLELNLDQAKFIDILNFPLSFIQKLYSWHFDIHNLISEGLAIDINTL